MEKERRKPRRKVTKRKKGYCHICESELDRITIQNIVDCVQCKRQVCKPHAKHGLKKNSVSGRLCDVCHIQVQERRAGIGNRTTTAASRVPSSAAPTVSVEKDEASMYPSFLSASEVIGHATMKRDVASIRERLKNLKKKEELYAKKLQALQENDNGNLYRVKSDDNVTDESEEEEEDDDDVQYEETIARLTREQLCLVGKRELDIGKYSEASTAFQLALQKSTGAPEEEVGEIWYNLALAFRGLQQYEEALAACEHGIACHETDKLYKLASEVARSLGDYTVSQEMKQRGQALKLEKTEAARRRSAEQYDFPANDSTSLPKNTTAMNRMRNKVATLMAFQVRGPKFTGPNKYIKM